MILSPLVEGDFVGCSPFSRGGCASTVWSLSVDRIGRETMSSARILFLTSMSLVAAAAFAGTAALPVSGNAGAELFSGNLCATASTGALSGLKVSGSCVQSASTKVRSTPFGSVRVVTHMARWGSFSAPTHHVTVAVIHVQGSAAAIAVYAKAFRAEVLANGIPVRLKPLTTEAGDTAACHNPPNDDCTRAEVMAIAGQYGVIGSYYGPARFVGADDPQDPSADDKYDVTQEDAVKGAVVELANSITNAL
jgi:hypothetical protein